MSRPVDFTTVINEIGAVVGAGDVTVREIDRLAYAQDYFWLPQMRLDRGVAPARPDIICYPESADEVCQLLTIATRHKIPVIPYGGGSGTQGGTVPLYGGIVLDLKKMNRIVNINETALTATVEAGLNVNHFEEELNRRGLTWAHYPASAAVATVGGCIAARGTGTISTKYGKAEDMVMSLEIALASGELINTLKTPNHACGPGILQLFVGAEGTLGIITKVTIRLEPMPDVRRFRGYLFNDLRDALEAGRRVMTRRLRPCTLRLYDPPSTKHFLKRVLNLDLEGSFLIVGCDGEAEMVELEEKLIAHICAGLGGKDAGRDAAENWWAHRYDFYFPPFAPALPRMYGTIESTTTFDCIYDLYLSKKSAIENGFKEYGARYTAHFSHWYPWGTMVYDRFYIDSPPAGAAEAEALHNKIWGVAARTNLAHGGTLNDHHGIGYKLGAMMPEQYGAAWDSLVKIKNVFDPLGIMNPGKLGFGPPKS
ncbi:MAG: FAD-binding oxidoreductase [Planctomycetes bacterium]|nr:FAD-binding oxidoreductase [Planctomycetota bacterium]